MAEDWSPEEVAATVADYFVMLGHELRGESYSKRAHNRALQQRLRGRTAAAIEFKHQNISAVLIESGFPYINGYKPASNYQALLRDEVVARLQIDARVVNAAEALVDAPAHALPTPRGLDDVLVDPPAREERPDGAYERRVPAPVPRLGVNYLEREARNASLGRAGEAFAFQVEHRRLWEAGHRHLAERMDHVSETRGDGLGYDILSFEPNGRERLIEVKTTSFGAMTPFFASRREVAVSEEHPLQFHVYRVYRFRDDPKVFVLPGSLRESCVLDATQYRASLR